MENEIIRWIKRRFFDRRVPIGAGFDDAALVKVPGRDILVSGDMLVEGTHFVRGEKPENIGRKAVSISLSDMAAMGAEPVCLLLSLGVPERYPIASVKRLFRGVASALKDFDTPLVGGDTVRSPGIVVDTVVIGANRRGKVLRRSGARPGDVILATGVFGSSLSTGWHCRFRPRIREMAFLKQRLDITSAIDASDGLHASLRILSQESGTRFRVDASRILFRRKRPTHAQSLRSALFDGEDFELVFTSRDRRIPQVRRQFQKKFKLPLSVLGKVESGRGLFFADASGRPVRPSGEEFRHFE
jgi:thiamine-monophosphate kinase